MNIAQGATPPVQYGWEGLSYRLRARASKVITKSRLALSISAIVLFFSLSTSNKMTVSRNLAGMIFDPKATYVGSWFDFLSLVFLLSLLFK